MTLTLLSKGKLQFTALLIGAIATFYAARYLRVVQMANAQVTAAPFFLELMISQPSPDGTLVPFRRMALARRSDGTTVSIESAGFLHSGQTSRKVTFLDGRSLSIVDALKMKSTWPVQRPEVVAALRARLTSPQKDCMPPSGRGPRLLGMEKLHGEDAAVIQSSEGGYRLTRWAAPRLGCETLQYRSEKVNPDGSLTLQAVGKAVNFTLGEPDSRLFDSGDQYQEALPSAIQSRSLEQAGFEETPDLKERGGKMDERYRRR
ncbi:MAG: hypothetical protein IT167_16075 [Bryobacterales bacterium]|nr:hypothetical protein [Bryobacterales bacterium]